MGTSTQRRMLQPLPRKRAASCCRHGSTWDWPECSVHWQAGGYGTELYRRCRGPRRPLGQHLDGAECGDPNVRGLCSRREHCRAVNPQSLGSRRTRSAFGLGPRLPHQQSGQHVLWARTRDMRRSRRAFLSQSSDMDCCVALPGWYSVLLEASFTESLANP